MARGFSKVILMGNLTRDVEMRTTASGQNVANFSLAVGRTWKDANGETKEQTSFINCVAWGRAGETIAQYVKKGNPLLVSGRLDQRSYEDKDGNKRSTVEVNVEDFTFVGGGRGGDDTTIDTSESQDTPVDEIDEKPIDLSEIPF